MWSEMDSCWIYDYKIKYFSHDLEKVIEESGVVIGKNIDDCMASLKRRYLDSDDEFDMVYIKSREFGEPSDVIPFIEEDK